MSNKNNSAINLLKVFGIVFIITAIFVGIAGYSVKGSFIWYILACILFVLGFIFLSLYSFISKAKRVKDKVSNVFSTISTTTNSIKNDTTTTTYKKTYSSSTPNFMNPFDMINMMFGNNTVKEDQEIHYCEYCGSEVDIKKKKCDSCGAKIIKNK